MRFELLNNGFAEYQASTSVTAVSINSYVLAGNIFIIYY